MSHKEQFDYIADIKEKNKGAFVGRRVLEVGSLDINGSVRNFFENCDYTGIDVAEGKGVDVVCQGQEYTSDDPFQTVISCECMEHNPYWKETLHNMYRLLSPGGCMIMTCAGVGRAEHGTTRTSIADSPLTISIGWDYYRNISVRDLATVFDIESDFTWWEMKSNPMSNDLYFIGFKP